MMQQWISDLIDRTIGRPFWAYSACKDEYKKGWRRKKDGQWCGSIYPFLGEISNGFALLLDNGICAGCSYMTCWAPTLSACHQRVVDWQNMQ